MKKTILILTVVMTGFASLSFARPSHRENSPAQESFKTEFSQAREVSWEAHPGFLKASFVVDGQFLYAYYTKTGDLIAVSRNISTNQLTMNARRELKKNFSDYWITDLFEISSNDETTYYVTLENADQKIVLKSSGPDQWEVYQKQAK
jgi:hypothetical protein